MAAIDRKREKEREREGKREDSYLP